MSVVGEETTLKDDCDRSGRLLLEFSLSTIKNENK